MVPPRKVSLADIIFAIRNCLLYRTIKIRFLVCILVVKFKIDGPEISDDARNAVHFFYINYLDDI